MPLPPMTTNEYAEYAGVTPRAVRGWRKAGRLVLLPDGRIRPEASDAARLATAERFRFRPTKPAEPLLLAPTLPAPPTLTLADLVAVGARAAAVLVADDEEPMALTDAVLAVQTTLAEVADRLGLDGWAVCLAVNVTEAAFVRAVEERAAALRAQYAVADAGIEL